MRHSLFFGTVADADKAQQKITESLIGLIDSYQSNDGESGTIEVRFFTDGPLDDWIARYLVRVTRPDTYALNCED